MFSRSFATRFSCRPSSHNLSSSKFDVFQTFHLPNAKGIISINQIADQPRKSVKCPKTFGPSCKYAGELMHKGAEIRKRGVAFAAFFLEEVTCVIRYKKKNVAMDRKIRNLFCRTRILSLSRMGEESCLDH